MARTNNLTNYLTDVADAIREKKGTTDTIPASSFDEEIKNLPSGGGDLEEYFRETLTSSDSLGSSTSSGAWRNAIKKIPSITIPSNTTSIQYFFAGFQGTTVPLFDTSNVTNMDYMFNGCKNLETIPLFNTSKTTRTKYMFTGCTNLTTVPLFDTSNVTSMYYMFNNCINLKTIPLFDTANVTDMSYMFENCSSLEAIPSFDTSNVTTMNSTFRGCSSVTEVPTLNTSKAINMDYLFQSCKIKEISYLDTSGANSIRGMFAYCSSLEKVCELDGTKLLNTREMFISNKPVFTDFGGIKDLGKAYETTTAQNYSNYSLSLTDAPNLSHDSLMNVINKLYDIASLGVKPQKLQLGSTNLAKLTADEISIAQNKGWSVS